MTTEATETETPETPEAAPETETAAAEAPEDFPVEVGSVIGKALPGEMAMVASMRKQANGLLYQMGLGVHNLIKQSAAFDQTEAQATALLQTVGQRLGVPKGIKWTIQDTGEVIVTAVAEGSEG